MLSTWHKFMELASSFLSFISYYLVFTLHIEYSLLLGCFFHLALLVWPHCYQTPLHPAPVSRTWFSLAQMFISSEWQNFQENLQETRFLSLYPIPSGSSVSYLHSSTPCFFSKPPFSAPSFNNSPDKKISPFLCSFMLLIVLQMLA